MVRLDAGVLLGNLGEGPLPQVVGADGVGLIDEGHLGLPARRAFPGLGEVEGVADRPLDALTRVHHGLGRDLEGLALVGEAVHAGVGVLGVLADDEHVHVIRPLALQRAEALLEELDRAQVHVQIEVEAAARDDAVLDLAGLTAGIADGAEVDGAGLLGLLEHGVGEGLAVLKEVVAADGQLVLLQGEAEDVGRGVGDLEGLLGDLGADAVAADDRDVVLAHGTLGVGPRAGDQSGETAQAVGTGDRNIPGV